MTKIFIYGHSTMVAKSNSAASKKKKKKVLVQMLCENKPNRKEYCSLISNPWYGKHFKD